MEVRTRFAPSPTGDGLHIGSLYTVLMNWAFAKKNNGKFIIRLEDTDRERLIEGSEERILDTLKAFPLNYDEGPDIGGPYAPYRQSERESSYKACAEELISKDAAYYCFCSRERIEEIKKKDQEEKVIKRHIEYCNPNLEEAREKIASGAKYVIRLKVPANQDISFNDVVRGEIVISSNQIDDQVLLKSDGFPTYHLAVVVDDYLMKITHIIRAEEWISSTPKHILLYRAFGWELPIFAHLPLLRNPDKTKLSKRKNPVWVSSYLEQGFLPEAMLNFLSLMGWSHPEEKEIFSLDEFVRLFDLKKISPAGPAFDIVKLTWMNGEYIRKMSDEELIKRIEEFYPDHKGKDKFPLLVPLIKERIKTLKEFGEYTDFIFEKPKYEREVVSKLKVGNIQETLSQILEKLEGLEKPWTTETFEKAFRDLAEELNLPVKDTFQLIRVAISGKLITPPLFESIEILGEDETIARVKQAQQFFS